jgi:hypothetical protein
MIRAQKWNNNILKISCTNDAWYIACVLCRLDATRVGVELEAPLQHWCIYICIHSYLQK